MGKLCEPCRRRGLSPAYGGCALIHASAPGAPGDTVAEAARALRAIHPEPSAQDAGVRDEKSHTEALTPSTFPGRVVPTIPGQLPLFD